MSRKVILSLIVVMALVMTSLILVQTNSIKKALEIKEEQFNASVKGALNHVVRKLEMEEASALLSENSNKTEAPGYGTFPDIKGNTTNKQNFIGPGNINLSLQYSQQKTSNSFSEEITINFSDSDKEAKDIRSVEQPSAFDILHDYEGYMRQQYENRLNQKARFLELALNRIQASSLPIEKRIDPQVLHRSIKNELQNYGINLDFRYAVKTFNRGEEHNVFIDNKYSPGSQKEYPTLLFPNDLDDLKKPNYLYVYFPKRKGYLLKQTGILVIPSAILTALLIGIFVYTIMIILKQKKLSIIKNDFINNMTHELKTPISTISLASQMLRDNTLSNSKSTIEHVSNVIYEESKRLSYQVEKVLQMAIFNEGRLKLKFKEVNLNTLINSVVLNFEIRVKNKNGELKTDLQLENPLIKGDEVHITNVLFNLLDNAVKYSSDEPNILIKTEEDKNFIIISVKDHGIGIPKEQINMIFERFYRIPTGNVHNVKGFGLGLSYVKKIVDSHNGKIKVESVPDKGTTFMIFLPKNIA